MIQFKSKEQGFSLVELMVVVAIIGVLAAVAIPQLGSYMAKAKQSEAKSSLASYYMAEKAFFAEYSSYDSRLGAIGYLPEGKQVYNVGQIAGFNAAAATYTIPAGASASFNSNTHCTVAANNCTNASATAALNAATAPAMTATSFTAVAAGIISSVSNDEWTINDVKLLTNTLQGYK